MSRFARRNLPALLVVVILGLAPLSAAQARPLHHSKSTDIYGPIDLSGLVHHLWTGFLSLWGADGAGADPNGISAH